MYRWSVSRTGAMDRRHTCCIASEPFCLVSVSFLQCSRFMICSRFHHLTRCFFCHVLAKLPRYDDLGPIKMCLLQSSQSRDHNGVMSGNCPEVTYPVDYALIWFEGAVGYWRASGDFDLMKQLLPLATACMDFFLSGACYKTSVGFSPTGYVFLRSGSLCSA